MADQMKVRRPGERTTHTLDSDSCLASYAQRFNGSRAIPPGKAIPVPGKDGYVVGIGAIEGHAELDDRAVEFDARLVLTIDRVIRNIDRAESTEVRLAYPGCHPCRIALRAPLGVVLHAVRRALRRARR